MLDGWEVDFTRLAPQIEAAVAYTGSPPTHRLDHLREAIADERMQFWPARDSFVITELLTTPSGVRLVNFFLAGGTLATLHQILPVIEGWARSQGCVRAMCTGRRGWERSFLTRTEGWRPSMTLYEKELGNG